MSNAEEQLMSNTIGAVNNSLGGCLKSTSSLGLLSDKFYHLGDSQSISLPFETASFCKLLEQRHGLKKPFTPLDFYKKNTIG